MEPFVSIEMLPADYGDALYINYGDEASQHHLLIDGGLSKSFKSGWKKRIRQLGRQGVALDLAIVTHIDLDHINGVQALIEANQQGRQPPSVIPVREVWFNQYRHIRPFGQGAVRAPDTLAANAPRWRSKTDFVAEVARRAPHLATLAARLAQAAPPDLTEVAPTGVADGEALADLLDGHYPSNTTFGGQAIVRVGDPPRVELPGGAIAWVLAPTPDGLADLYRQWENYLRANDLAALLSVTGLGPLAAGDALVPGFVQQLMLRTPGAFDTLMKGREEDLDEPIQALAQREFKEDSSVANGSSIALLFEYAGKRLLLTGDAHSHDVAEGLRRLGYSSASPVALGAFKLAHHGSRANTGDDLLNLVQCDRYLISTNGDRFGHPDKECLARVIWANRDRGGTTFYFNYPNTAAAQALDVASDRARYGYSLECVAGASVII